MNEINWKEYIEELNTLFFTEKDYIKRGTKQYDDFFAFFWRYLTFLKKRNLIDVENLEDPFDVKVTSTTEKDFSIWDSIPKKYDSRYSINCMVVNKALKEKLKHKNKYSRSHLNKKNINDFQSVILKYIDFCQKQSFSKLKKLQQQQNNLPIAQHRQEILKALEENQIIIVAGDTGCGKSTQVPQYLLHAGFQNIACTQPRRIAAISLSKRVSYETLNLFGSQVAYKIRFEGTRTKATKILFLTEGLLLRQMQTDSSLEQYDVVILDEVHERHLHSDLLLGMFRNVLRHRKNLKLILMSATINLDLFSNYFKNAPVVQVPGRLFPISVNYFPIPIEEQSSKSERLDPRPYVRILQGIDKKYPSSECGDLLIFLSGMSEIQSVFDAVSAYAEETKRWIVLLLHSTLSVDEQDKVFDIAPEGVRKCILSTNIAETSVTIDGVRFICDSGKVKEMNYDDKYKMQKLQEFWISRASAEQRKGRAGRTGPGVCFRLYSEEDYEALIHYSTPEIKRVPLNSLILQMKSMGISSIQNFEFIEAPEKYSIEGAILTLKDQGALDKNEKLTPIGHMLSQLPVDVVVGKMLIMGSLFDMIEPIMSIAATLSVQSPLTRNAYNNAEMSTRRQPLESSHGDPFTLLNIFDEWVTIKQERQTSSRKWCKRRGLEEQRFYEMTNLKKQFRDLLEANELLAKNPKSDTVSSKLERQKRYAEKKRLVDLKRKQVQDSSKKKVLKLEDHKYQIEEPDDEQIDNDDINDVKDLQFKLRHDLDKLYKSTSEGRKFTLGDITLLKIILASGLFPQIAIADECNSYRRESEQIFHTKNKAFVVLHPTGYFANQPDVLEPSGKEDSTLLVSGLSSKRGLLSHKHQILTYVSLLETMKPYVVNTMRVPALQTCLLFSQSLDTNEFCTRIIADNWIEFIIPDKESAQETVSATLQLRNAWEHMLNLRLKRVNANKDMVSALSMQNENIKNTLKLQRSIAKKLTEFLDSKVLYRFKRIGSVNKTGLYVGPGINSTDLSDFKNILKCKTKFIFSLFNASPNHIKGGMNLSSFLVYNCLKPEGSEDTAKDYIQTVWTCPKCEIKLAMTVLERFQHQAMCSEEVDEDEEVKVENDSPIVTGDKKRLQKEYYCEICDKYMQLSSVQILKHKKSHKS